MDLIAQERIRARLCHCLSSMNVFILPVLGNGEGLLFPFSIYPQRDDLFFFFFFGTKVATGSVLGIKLSLGGGGALHLLLPGFNSVKAREKTILYSL